MGYQKRNADISDHTDPERGANLVEFAILAPLLVILVLGIVEFGWVFGQFNEVRHAAQEGARWGAVSNPDVDGNTLINTADLIDRVCNASNLAPTTSLTIDVDNAGGLKGATATVTVTATITSLSNAPLITDFLPADVSSTATFRLERDAVWATAVGQTC